MKRKMTIHLSPGAIGINANQPDVIAYAKQFGKHVRAELALPAADFPKDDRLKEMGYGAWEGMMWPRHAERTPAISSCTRNSIGCE